MRHENRILTVGFVLLGLVSSLTAAPLGIDLALESTVEDLTGEAELIIEPALAYYLGSTGVGFGAMVEIPLVPDASMEGAEFWQEYRTVVPGLGIGVGHSLYVPVAADELEAMIYATVEHSQGPFGVALEADGLYYPDLELLLVPALSAELDFDTNSLYAEVSAEILVYDEQLMEELSIALGYEIILRGTTFACEIEPVYIQELSDVRWNATVALERTF